MDWDFSRYVTYVLKDEEIFFFQEENEDMWHVYNLVAIGDKLRASTFRKVVTESNTGNL